MATGNQRELNGIDLFDPACIIEHVITVDALRRVARWPCSSATMAALIACDTLSASLSRAILRSGA